MTVTRGSAGATLAAEITDILVAHCGLDSDAAARAPDACLAELGMDSLALLELQAVVADRYGARIPTETGHLSIRAVADLVAEAIASGTTTPAEAEAEVPGQPGPADTPERITPGHTENSVVIGAPRRLVWALTNDVRTWPDLFTEYRSVEVLHEDGNTVRFRLTMHPDPDGTVWSWVSERTCDPQTWQVHARRVEPGPFVYMRLHWRYDVEPDGRTRMTWIQDFDLRPDAPIDNRAMEARINANSQQQMAIIRDRIERIARQRGLEVDGDE